jgi:membrane glycosyltransferase
VIGALALSIPVSVYRRAPGVQSRREHAIAVAVARGPRALTDRQKLFFLSDRVALSRLHVQVSRSPRA